MRSMRGIAIIGGGPGGASAALALARGGVEVDLYLPARPGEKPCGGAVPEHVLPRLAGFDPHTLPTVEAPPALLENDRGSRYEIRLDGIRIFRRSDFDRALVEAAIAAGARARRRRVDRLEPGADGVRVVTGGEEREYAWVIGADGARGLSRRTVGLRPEGESVGLGGSLLGVPARGLALCFLGLEDAYAWIFPRPGGVSVGVAYTAGRLGDAAARAGLDDFLDQHLRAGWRTMPGPRYRYPIPVFGPWTLPGLRRALARRLLLVGDAAALADPLTREGIRFGLLSGIWAAEALIAGDPESYAERVARELGEEMEHASLARELFFSGGVGRWMVPVSRLHRGVRQVLQDLLACRQPYRGLTARLVRAALSL
jgi:flavin-dependent dehydrogenase